VANPDPEVRSSGTVHPLVLTRSAIVVNEHKGESVEFTNMVMFILYVNFIT